MSIVAAPESELDPKGKTEERPSSGLIDAIVKLSKEARTRNEFLQLAINLLGDKSKSLYAVVQTENKSNIAKAEFSIDKAARATWRSLGEGVLLDTRYRRESRAKITKQTLESETKHCLLATPISISGQGVVGAIALVRPHQESLPPEKLLESLTKAADAIGQGLMQIEQASAPKKALPTENVSEAGILKLANVSGVTEFAYSLVNSLKARLGAEQLSLGIVEGHRINMACVSGLDKVNRHSAGIRLIEQAMYEALDSKTPAFSQEGDSSGATENHKHHLLHQKWRTQTQAKFTASIPLIHNDEIVAVLGIRDSREKGIKPDQLDKIRSAVEPFLSLLNLLKRSERHLIQHAKETIVARIQTLVDRRTASVLSLMAILLFGSWFAFSSQTYTVTAPYTFDVSNRLAVSASFSGVLEENHVEPGQFVRTGEILGRLDTTNLLSQQQDLEYELRRAQLELSKALEQGEPANLARAKLQREAALAQLKIIETQIKRSTLRAPCDGYVLSSDLTTRQGDTIAEGELLYEIGAEKGWLAKIEVNERLIQLVDTQQQGYLVPLADPTTKLACNVQRIEGAARDTDGDRTVLVVAQINDAPSGWIKPGMRGVARIQVGKQPTWWIWTHEFTSRFQVGSWGSKP